MTRPATARRALPLLLAVLVAVGLALAPATAAPAHAARPDLTIVSEARYEVQPDEKRVRITVDLVATNHLKDSATRRYYFDRAYLAVLPGTSGFKLSGGSGKPSVSVSQRKDDYTLLLLRFGQRIYSGKKASFKLTFNLPDKGGAPTRDVRVGESLVSFPVWAFATDSTPGSSVEVVFPKGFNVQLESGSLPKPSTAEDGRITFASGTLDAPLTFFAYFVADRPSTFEQTTLTVKVGSTDATLGIRSWPDDPDWAKRVRGLFGRGLPVLSERIGLAWPRTQPLVVQEAVSRTTGGYAGLFDPKAGRVEVAYYADAFVILHEAAHAWFNGGLLADRWANEGFASYYALETAEELGEKASTEPLTDELRRSRIPLNAWGAVGRGSDATEDYGYAASLELAREIAKRAGDAGLSAVWNAATGGVGAYQPIEGKAGGGVAPVANVREAGAGVPDWRGFLDLLEDQTGKPFDDLWREWVVRDTETNLLDARKAARDAYLAVVEQAGDWRLPAAVREALRAWQFDHAGQLLEEARGVLDQRRRVEAEARAAGLTPPPTLETAFESNAGFAAAAREATAELATIDAVEAALASRVDNPDPVEALGLWGTAPETDVVAARTAFAAGDLQGAARSAGAAEATWRGAADVGRNRLLTMTGVVLLVALALLFVVAQWRRRRRAPTITAAVVAVDPPAESLADSLAESPPDSPPDSPPPDSPPETLRS